MATFYALLYWMYSVLKNSGVEGLLRRWQRGGRGLDQLKRLMQRQFWVRVQSGLSQGMWMKLRLPSEGGYWRGTHEADVQNAISVAAQPGTVIYDIGAHVGSIALGTARLVGDLGRVVAFDGDPENVLRLRDNSSRNGLEDRLQVVHAAVWSRNGSDGISFRRGSTVRSQGGVEANGNRPVLGNGEVIKVPAVTLDEFVAAGGPLPQLIKIDVEGGEYQVLRGGASLFASQKPLIIAEVHHQQAAEQILAWLDEYHYCSQWNIPREGFPRRLFAWPTEYDGAAWMQHNAGNAATTSPKRDARNAVWRGYLLTAEPAVATARGSKGTLARRMANFVAAILSTLASVGGASAHLSEWLREVR
jgi:FkbM family methyltransferase